MSGEILVRLVNVTKYFRDTANMSPFRRLHNKEQRYVEVNNVTIHLYRGETLGITGLPGSGKSVIGKLISKVIEPSSGKVRNDSPTFLASHNHRFTGRHSLNQMIETILLSYNVPLTDFPDKIGQILSYAELQDKSKSPFDQLTVSEKSQLFIALTYFLKPEVVIYDELSRHLTPLFKEKFRTVIDLLMMENKAVVLIEDELKLIEEKANYMTWISHGQVRKSGKPEEVMPVYENYLSRYNESLRTKNGELFDLDYKMQRQAVGNEEAMRRVSRHSKSLLDKDVKKLLLTTLVVMTLCLIMFILVWQQVAYEPKTEMKDETAIVKKKEAFTDKYAFVVVEADNQPIIYQNRPVVKVPAGTLMEVTGFNDTDYRISYGDKAMTMKRSHMLYINPAALYDEHDFDELSDYMYSNYANFKDFFNSYLGKSHATINKELYPESSDRFRIKLTKNDIFLHFNDANKMTGISFPMLKADELKKKFNIKDRQWIVKIGDAYAVADFERKQWLYFKM
ncbi:ATP-binding cassette domain-containing protein [Macrococcus equipercicus]|uniref:ABC transporter ATP-binding protein n=1 Tax=Macrococcus equipercicus TaxID=69967 RepID=A0A9Q9BKQ9_9STAP|nr:ATP-binding cassette domain-containing protein [Macrococcus equipercicus]KAA1037671.1 ABC transporter ATP-binding protein [Macrococcus equipercicus]UTH13383.1 ABC transporter ATP-binding protein [Macrococcus equipercicus]